MKPQKQTLLTGLFRLIWGLHLTHPSVSHPAGSRRSFRLGMKSSWARQAARSKRWSVGVNVPNPPPTYREVIPYRRDPEDGHRLVLLVGGYELQKPCGWNHLWKETSERRLAGSLVLLPLKRSPLELPLTWPVGTLAKPPYRSSSH